MLSSNHKGAIAEMKIATTAVELGIPILKPVQEHCRYDLGFEVGGRILRVQCKWGALDASGNVIKVSCVTYSLTYSHHRRSSYTADEIDLLAVYCGDLDQCYLLPSALACGRTEVWLRLTPARNGASVH
ncbi:MAG TPA: group I intron-associated PD-(D/E)XK endonuclease [Thermoleophilaceae bacterium]|nr:group I intron-associated PD-(D/E)XK endonuclease [Thermoleophilaceae bacterium]